MKEERDLIDKLIGTGDGLLAIGLGAPDFGEQLLQLRITGAQLSSVTNDAVGEMTRHAESAFWRLVWVGVGLGIVLVKGCRPQIILDMLRQAASQKWELETGLPRSPLRIDPP